MFIEHSVLIFGEVLFDIFPDNTKVIGGAPFNVACHLKGFGSFPLFMSRIGDDELGNEAVSIMKAKSLSQRYLQKDDRRETGKVFIKIENNNPSYSISEHTAYDYIELPNELEGIKLLYHGSLAARNKVSAKTLYKLARDKKKTVFCDINLRYPWYNEKLIKDILSWADFLKVNEDELNYLCKIEGICKRESIGEMACILRAKRQQECLILTLGEKGAMLFPSGEDPLYAPSPDVHDFRDSVGAGDAFSSVFLVGLQRGWSWRKILERAVSFAAHICSNKGAIPQKESLYMIEKKKWEKTIV